MDRLVILLFIIPFTLGVFSPTKDTHKSNSLSSDKDDILKRLVDEITDLKAKYSNLESKLEQVESDAELKYLDLQGKYEDLQTKFTDLESKIPTVMTQKVHNLVSTWVYFS